MHFIACFQTMVNQKMYKSNYCPVRCSTSGIITFYSPQNQLIIHFLRMLKQYRDWWPWAMVQHLYCLSILNDNISVLSWILMTFLMFSTTRVHVFSQELQEKKIWKLRYFFVFREGLKKRINLHTWVGGWVRSGTNYKEKTKKKHAFKIHFRPF